MSDDDAFRTIPDDLRHFDPDAFQLIPKEVAGGILAWGLFILLLLSDIWRIFR